MCVCVGCGHTRLQLQLIMIHGEKAFLKMSSSKLLLENGRTMQILRGSGWGEEVHEWSHVCMKMKVYGRSFLVSLKCLEGRDLAS